MYVEIGARRSGKTTRLLKSVAYAALEGKTCIVVAINAAHARFLEHRFKELSIRGDVKFVSASYVNSVNFKERKIEAISTFWFYDEFDLMDSRAVIISENGEYYGTLARERTGEDVYAALCGKEDVYFKLICHPKATVVCTGVLK